MRRLSFVLLWLIEATLVSAAALLLAVWLWSGSEGSLATLLRQLQPWLPAGQTLAVTDVQGSIRGGGRIGSLHWRSGDSSVRATDLRLAWRPLDLLERRITFTELSIARLEVEEHETSPPTPAQAPPELVLPLPLDLPFRIARLRIDTSTTVLASDLAGRYRFQDEHHRLELASVDFAQGRYRGTLDLQARAPMTLDLQLQGRIEAAIPQGSDVAVEATATVRGALAGRNPRLDLLAQLQPAPGTLATARAMRATLTAQIDPWAAQPVVLARASFNHLDLAALWPVAPRSQLTGNAWLRPVGADWQLDVNLVNRLPGPWDKGRLPLESARALVQLGQSQWSVQAFNADIGGGHIRLQGTLAEPSTASLERGWAGQLTLQGVDPALLHSRLDRLPLLDGTLDARAASQAIAFDAALQPAAGRRSLQALRGLRLREVVAHGRWSAAVLQFDALRVRTAEAALEGQVELRPDARSARGQLQLAAPGLLGRLSGRFGALDGNGELTLTLADAARSRAWMARLPMAPAWLDGFDIQGSASASARWSGGWQALQLGAGAPLTFSASLQSPRWQMRAASQTPVQAIELRELDLQARGSLQAMQIALRGQAQRDGQQARIVASLSGERDPREDWYATLHRLQLQVQDPRVPGRWDLALTQPLRVDYARAASRLAIGAGQAQVNGPRPGTVVLAWEASTLTAAPTGTLRSQGALRGVPMDWLDLLAGFDAGAAGLSGDLLFDGQWDLTLGDRIALRASLGRRSGDLRIHPDGLPGEGRAADVPAAASTDNSPGSAAAQTGGAAQRRPSAAGRPPDASAIDAGVRDLLLQLQVEGERVAAQFRWDSERAGNAQASFSTRLVRDPDGWSWPASSPLEARLRARMPQLGVWSLLAPPGWRVRGTVDADLALHGTRDAPRWNGRLLASDVAVRSLADGIEFGNGQLRASLQGQRLDIEQFSLQGAGGASGGSVNATGFVLWAPSGQAGEAPLQAIRMQIDAQARALRVSARADRRLSVSGTLQAVLDQARLRIRGALTADQALFILPEETAPTLGEDVVVLGPGQPAASANAAAARTTVTRSAATRPALQSDLQLTLDLGRDFRVRGHGIDTRMTGVLTLAGTLGPGAPPSLTGTLQTVGGVYRAYGQLLEIERGQLRFSGAYDNPALDVLAIRPMLSQRVGVQITGTALLPRVRLYADPELPETEKLAWLVLGRSGANGGAEAAVLQQAALALLGGQDHSGSIASRLGLDELSFSGAADNGSGSTRSATVTLGKRLSQNFYVAYEHGLTGTLGTLSIFYDLSQRFTLRASTGEKSAIDLILRYRYD